MEVTRTELSRSDKETVYLVQKGEKVEYEVETPDGKLWDYESYVNSQPIPKEPVIVPPPARWYHHPALWSGGAVVIAVTLSHLWK